MTVLHPLFGAILANFAPPEATPAPRPDPARELYNAFNAPGDVVVNVKREAGLPPELESFVGPSALADAKQAAEDRWTHEPRACPSYENTLILRGDGTFHFRDLWPAR